VLVHEAARPCRRFYQPWATKLRNALRKQTKCSNRLLTRETWNGGARGRCRADNIYFHAYWISVPSKDLFLRQKFTLHRQQNNARSPKCTNAWKSVCGCALVPSFNKGGAKMIFSSTSRSWKTCLHRPVHRWTPCSCISDGDMQTAAKNRKKGKGRERRMQIANKV